MAAYIALFTGCSVSLAAAGTARWLIVAACIFSFAYLAYRTTPAVALGRRQRLGTPPAA
jgi:hypothetical protein